MDTGQDQRKSRLPAVIALLVPAISLLFVASIGSVSELIREDIPLTETSLGLISASYFLSSAAFSLVGARLVERFGAARSLLVSSLIVAAGSAIIGGLVADYWQLVLVAVILGSTNGMSQPAANDLISGNVIHHRGLAYGVKQCALPLAAAVGSIGFSLVALRFGWRAFYLTVVVLALIVGCIAWLNTRGTPVLRTARGAVLDRRNSRIRSVPKLLFVGGAGAFVGNAMTTFYIPASISAGIDAESAAWSMGVGSMVGVAVRLILGRQWDRRHFNAWTVVAFQFWIWGFAFLLLSQMTGYGVGVVVALLGFGFGWAWPGLFHLSLSGMMTQSVARATSIIMLGVYVGGLAGPLIVGFTIASVSYATAWLICATLCGLNGLVCMSIRSDLGYSRATE